MVHKPSTVQSPRAKALARRLLRDTSGNTLAMIAAAVLPMLAMIGGGIDMGRSYLSQTRLQQACDAGVLAARKKLGSAVVLTGTPPADVKTIGDQFFNQNFRIGQYGTNNRSFAMTLESDYAISGVATVEVPTTIMYVFGYKKMALSVNCQAKLNFSNTDIMFVLDTTGSMLETNPSDTQDRLTSMKQTVKNFHTQIEGSKAPGTRIRYGFVPYSTNVNVGFLLKSDWLVDKWNYHGRVPITTGKTETYDTYSTTTTVVSGTYNSIAAYQTNTCPPNTYTVNNISSGTNPDGSTYGRTVQNGDYYWCNVSSDGSLITVTGMHFDNYTYDWLTKNTGTATREIYEWVYRPVNMDLAFLKGATGNDPPKQASVDVQMYGSPSPSPANITAWFRGCVEERETYEISDYSNVDLKKALDLDIDLVPTKGITKTQWRPIIHEISFEPEIWWDGTGTFKSPAQSGNDYLMAAWAGLSACPAPAQKLAEMTDGDIDTYLGTLYADGSTYHDIGMIWGGRLLSPTGLFASENGDAAGKTTSRHMIFLTDGQTAPYDLSYGTYGIEPLDKRRWNPDAPAGGFTQTEVIEKRFAVACEEVKKRNVTVWVIGFGTSLNPVMTDCAGPGHFFEASNAAELNDVFSMMAAQMGELRISK